MDTNIGTGTNLKVGGGHRSGASAGKKIWSYPSTFFGCTRTISRFGERFHDGQYSSVSFLFAVLLLTVPPVPSPAICKSGGHVPPCPMKSAPLGTSITSNTRTIFTLLASITKSYARVHFGHQSESVSARARSPPLWAKHSPIAICIITQSFYQPTKAGRLSRPRHSS